MKRLAMIALATTLVGAPATLAQEDRVLAFPENYRTEFVRYYSGDRLLAEEQTITLYANAAAVEAARKGGMLPSGSVLVAEVYAAQKDAEGNVIESALGRRVQGDLLAIALMERRDGWDAQYPDNLKVGDWEFEAFSPAGENLARDTTGCRECHHPLADTDFTFSLEHLRASN